MGEVARIMEGDLDTKLAFHAGVRERQRVRPDSANNVLASALVAMQSGRVQSGKRQISAGSPSRRRSTPMCVLNELARERIVSRSEG